MKACEKGFIGIVKFVAEYFGTTNQPPHEFNIYADDERTGENCA
jgi:hypothetical protein